MCIQNFGGETCVKSAHLEDWEGDERITLQLISGK
jgi:hypothetical protein